MNEKQKEQARLRKQKQRDKEQQNSVTSNSVTSNSVTSNSVTSNSVTSNSVTLLNRPNGLPYNPEEIWEGQPRYVGPFSDGQVLDRKTVPLPAFNPPVGGFTPNKVTLGDGSGVRPTDKWKVNGNA